MVAPKVISLVAVIALVMKAMIHREVVVVATVVLGYGAVVPEVDVVPLFVDKYQRLLVAQSYATATLVQTSAFTACVTTHSPWVINFSASAQMTDTSSILPNVSTVGCLSRVNLVDVTVGSPSRVPLLMLLFWVSSSGILGLKVQCYSSSLHHHFICVNVTFNETQTYFSPSTRLDPSHYLPTCVPSVSGRVRTIGEAIASLCSQEEIARCLPRFLFYPSSAQSSDSSSGPSLGPAPPVTVDLASLPIALC
ncbi:hypothetical protein Acr_22g0002180 [Actinidia rufa]|uniref:Uncharacterized protein n=1 Tax=Actinidia rufa TaxID=165716 RepID=A0A7J0GJ33_9ERIC|nr:hypothetical protein Acr_22g0002180 [Actinidia rufa]